jgi:hypothetical protein
MSAKSTATPSSNRKEMVKLVIGLAAIAAAVGIWYGRHQSGGSVYDSFAQCLTQKKTTMFGLYWCEHCAEQKEMFGNAFRYINYEECGAKGGRGEVEKCKQAGLKNFPTWQFANGERREGVMTMAQLSQLSGCPLE